MTISCSDHARIMVGLSSNRLYIGGSNSESFQCNLEGYRVTLLAPRIVNDVSYVTRINHEINVAWQVQYLVTLEGDCGCSAHSK